MVIPRAGGLAGAAGGHDQGTSPAGGRGGVSTGGRGGGPAGGSSATLTLGKGKQAHVVLNDDEVSSDENDPLQKQLWQLSGAAGPSGSGPAPSHLMRRPRPLPGAPNVEVVLGHFHRCRYRSSPLWFFYWEGL
jgi:hypothetical protein